MERIKLGELCKIINGKPNPQKDIAFDKVGIPFVRMRDLGKYHHTTNLVITETFLNENYAEKNGFKKIKKGAILLPKSGSVSLNHRAILGIEASIVDHICALEVIDNNRLNNYYLYYYLTLLDMGKIAQRTTGIDFLPPARLAETKIPIIPIIEQSKIVARLNKIQDFISNRTEAISLWDDYLRSVFLEMFGDPILNPKSWEKVQLKTLGEIVTGSTPPKKDDRYYTEDLTGIDWIKSDNIQSENFYNKPSYEKLSVEGERIARIVKKNSTLIISITGSKNRLGDCVMAIEQLAFNQQINAFVPTKNPFYHYFLFKNLKHQIQKLSSNGQKQMVSKNALEHLQVIKTDEALQNKFERIFQQISLQKEKSEQSLALMNTLSDSFLQSTFSDGKNVDEEKVFEEILQSLKIEDLKEGDRLKYLLNLMSKDAIKFSEYGYYDIAWKKTYPLLEDGTLIQVFEKGEIKLKLKK